MSIEIIKNNNPYVIDYIQYKDKKIPALTRKNARFFEAVVNLDSKYAKDLDKSKVNSTAYYFEELNDCKNKLAEYIPKIMESINKANSTRLSKSELEELARVVCDKCNNCNQLIELLNKKFDNNHLIALLTKKTRCGNRYNISFATKFCFYASKFLGAEEKYSKYDNIVAKSLPIYIEVYLGERVKQREYIINHSKKQTDEDKYLNRLEIYKKYSNDIERIIASLKRAKITKEEFDHIIWYGLK